MELHEKTYEEFLEDSIVFQKRGLIEKACNWLRSNFYHEETMVDCIAYKYENEDINVMIENFKKAMEE